MGSECRLSWKDSCSIFFFQAEDGIRDLTVTGVQTCALPILRLGHALALRRVLLNLTTNALKFTERGSVDIVAVEQSPTRIRFTVRDTGPGINPEALASLIREIGRAHV